MHRLFWPQAFKVHHVITHAFFFLPSMRGYHIKRHAALQFYMHFGQALLKGNKSQFKSRWFLIVFPDWRDLPLYSRRHVRFPCSPLEIPKHLRVVQIGRAHV